MNALRVSRVRYLYVKLHSELLHSQKLSRQVQLSFGTMRSLEAVKITPGEVDLSLLVVFRLP